MFIILAELLAVPIRISSLLPVLIKDESKMVFANEEYEDKEKGIPDGYKVCISCSSKVLWIFYNQCLH